MAVVHHNVGKSWQWEYQWQTSEIYSLVGYRNYLNILYLILNSLDMFKNNYLLPIILHITRLVTRIHAPIQSYQIPRKELGHFWLML